MQTLDIKLFNVHVVMQTLDIKLFNDHVVMQTLDIKLFDVHVVMQTLDIKLFNVYVVMQRYFIVEYSTHIMHQLIHEWQTQSMVYNAQSEIMNTFRYIVIYCFHSWDDIKHQKNTNTSFIEYTNLQ